jgi:hypothetical protein
MTQKSSGLMILVMAVFVILSAGMAGCATTAPSSPAPMASPIPAKTLSTITPAEMALQQSDLPADFTLLERGERNVSEMRSWSLDQGWKGGYYSDYVKNDTNSRSATLIEQSISVYNPGTISLIVPDTVSYAKNWSAEDRTNRSVEEVALPAFGDSSSVLKISDKSDNSHEYIIAFVKYDVFEQLYTNGTETDYETLKQLAGTAAAKIR